MNKVVSVTPDLSEHHAAKPAADSHVEPSPANIDDELSYSETHTEHTELKTDIIGYVEQIADLQINGWVIHTDQQPLQLSLRIDEQNYAITYTWLERADIADMHGATHPLAGFSIEIPSELIDTFELAQEEGQTIAVLANGIELPNKAKANSDTSDSAEDIVNPQDEADTTTLASVAEAIDDELFFVAPQESVFDGCLERIQDNLLFGWVINRNQQPIELSLCIDETLYPITPLWINRLDIAEQLGDEFLTCGFKIELPLALAEILWTAHQRKQAIAIIANGVALQNKIDPDAPILGTKPLVAAQKTSSLTPKKITIKGYVERIEHFCFYGWAINLAKKPFKLKLIIDGIAYPVMPEWLERWDIAGQFGNDFLKSGFKITLSQTLIDIFLNACEQEKSIDIIADDDIVLHSAIAPESLTFNRYCLGAELATNPHKFVAVSALNAEYGVEISNTDFGKLLSGHILYPLRISHNDTLNANYYIDRAKQKLLVHDLHSARSLLKISLFFAKKADALELLGNTYFEQQDYETASSHYEEAAASPGNPSRSLFANLIECKKHMIHPRDVIEALLRGIEKNPDAQNLLGQFDELIHGYWMKQQGTLEVFSIVDKLATYPVTNNREALIAKMSEASAVIYHAYLRFYGATENPHTVSSCNANRVLIVGDFHIPQCVRYRIDQKIEQLEAAGKEVKAISWTDLANQQNALTFYDVVIFYRVPAEPQVLKAMAQVNATGRLSFYEIDDLLFDAAYPPALATYGGYLDLNTYLHITKGMASFNAAARYCRFGIASTQPLADRLQKLVFGQQCFVHRNGVDSLNMFKHKHHDAAKENLDIFYGSGTMAHNSDFTDLILPAMTRLFDEYPHIGLKIVGYLKLPDAFLAKYSNRIKQMPPVKSIKAYWSMLERADINLAVLHDDDVNGCKSELKWFEAGCLGIPSVVSSTVNYRDVIRHGEDALLASTTDDWYQHLKTLIDDAPLRQHIAEAARAKVESDYSIEALSAHLTKLLANALVIAQGSVQPKRKKIALVNVFFPPQSIGGATRVVADNFDLLRRDYADQFELSVFTSDVEHKPPYQMTLYNHQGVRVYRSTIVWREHMDWQPIDKQMGELFSEYLAAEQPDLVHFHCIQRLTASIVEATIAAQIPYIVTVHDAWWISDYQFLVDNNNVVYPEGHPDPYLPCKPPNNISLTESIERVLYLKELLRNARVVLTVSNCFADIYRNNDIPHIQINKNGISESLNWQAKNTSYTDKVVCGHVGGMAEHKGYFLLKEAIELLQPTHLEMLIVDHAQEEDYRLQTQWGQVPVTFIGRMSQTRVVDLYQQLDVLLAPSTWPESYGLVTREAAACSCWVVASTMGGIGEDVIEGESGFVIEPTLDALTACLKHIDKNPTLFKANAQSPVLRRVSEQVKELAIIYSAKDD